MNTLTCDEAYLRFRFGVHLGIVIIVSIGLCFLSVPVAIGVLAVAGSLCGAELWAWRRFRFSYGAGALHTDKIFTKDLDVSTPTARVQSVSAYEGVIEAICGVGSIEFSTASSDSDQATFVWPAIRNHRQIAETLMAEVKSMTSR